MSIVRSPNDVNQVINHTDMINKIDRQFQLFPDQMFDIKSTNQTSVIFDVNETKTTLFPSVDRGSRGSVYGSDDKVRTHALPLAYFKASDYITSADILSQRRVGTAQDIETLDLVRADKLVKLRRQADQTQEYLKLQAIKGVFKTPEGTEYANMFQEFGIAQEVIDFELGNNTTDVLAKCRIVKRKMKDALQNGGFVSGINAYVDPDFYDALISHDSVKEAYKYYQGITNQAGNGQPLRDDLNDQFVFGGIRFISLDGSFALPAGNSEQLVANDTGHVVPVAADLFRGYNGPSNKLASITELGQDMFAWEYPDPKGEAHEIQAEMSKLFFCTRPKALFKLTA